MVKFAVRLIHLCRKFTIIIVVILSHLENVKSCTASIMQDFELVLQTAYVVNVKILHQLDYFASSTFYCHFVSLLHVCCRWTKWTGTWSGLRINGTAEGMEQYSLTPRLVKFCQNGWWNWRTIGIGLNLTACHNKKQAVVLQELMHRYQHRWAVSEASSSL